jgi:hypothetical protein
MGKKDKAKYYKAVWKSLKLIPSEVDRQHITGRLGDAGKPLGLKWARGWVSRKQDGSTIHYYVCCRDAKYALAAFPVSCFCDTLQQAKSHAMRMVLKDKAITAEIRAVLVYPRRNRMLQDGEEIRAFGEQTVEIIGAYVLNPIHKQEVCHPLSDNY